MLFREISIPVKISEVDGTRLFRIYPCYTSEVLIDGLTNTCDLRTLCDVTDLSVKIMYSIIANHYEIYGVNIAVNANGKMLVATDYADMIREEYEIIRSYIVPMETLRKEKSDRIVFKIGSYVYFLFAGKDLVYVGQTVSLADRVASHLGDKTFDKVCYVEVPASIRLIVEDANISHYAPKYNSYRLLTNEIFAQVLRRLFS